MNKEFLKRLSWPILLSVGTLLIIGLLFIWSGSLVLIGQEGEIRHLAKAKKQLVWMAIGGVAMFAALIPHYRRFIDYAYVVYAAGIGLLILLFILSKLGLTPVIHGARRWIPLGFFHFQPSELMKIALILCLARYLQYRSSYRKWLGLIVPFGLTFVPMLLIVKQPDLGTSLLFLPILFACLFIAGARVRHLFIVLALAIGSAPVMYFHGIQAYQKDRIIGFLKQSEIHSEAAKKELYQLIQSKMAIGSGGWFGHGWQQGTMNRLNYLPVRTTDFIFSVIGEEVGFTGLLVVLFLYFIFFSAAFTIVDRTREPSGRLIVIGAIVLLSTQLYINTAMTIGLMPITGLTLPFISYGGSSMVSSFILLGLILNVGMRQTQTVATEDFEFQDDISRRKYRAETERWTKLFRFRKKKGF